MVQATSTTPAGSVRLALDIGGTKLAAAVIEPDGRPGEPARVPTPKSDVWAACRNLLTDVAAGRSVDAVGISSAGPVDLPAGSVAPINITEWSTDGFPVVAAIEKHFAGADVRLAGDGICAILAEHRFGVARGEPNCIGMVVSTGIGGGIILDGHPVTGRSGNAGHLGHVVVVDDGDPCTCGGRGCVETVASGPHSVRWARSQGWAGEDGKQLADDARGGNPIAVAALERAGRAVGSVLASVAATVDAPLAVVGGGFSLSGPPLWDPLHRAVADHAGLSFLHDFRVVPAELGSGSSLMGAACLVSPAR